MFGILTHPVGGTRFDPNVYADRIEPRSCGRDMTPYLREIGTVRLRSATRICSSSSAGRRLTVLLSECSDETMTPVLRIDPAA